MAEPKSATVLFQLPIWVIGLPSAKIKSLARASDPSGIKGAVIFTKKDLAQQYLDADSRLSGNVLWAVFDPWHLFGLLALLERAGIGNVIIDPEPTPAGVSKGVPAAAPIAGLRAYAEQLVL